MWTDLLWGGNDALELAEEDLCADFWVEVFDLLSDLFWGELLDALDKNF